MWQAAASAIVTATSLTPIVSEALPLHDAQVQKKTAEFQNGKNQQERTDEGRSRSIS